MKVVYDLREILFQGRGWERYGIELLTELQHFPSLNLKYILVDHHAAMHSYPKLFERAHETLEMPINKAPRTGGPTCAFVETADIYHSLTDYPEFLPTNAKLVASIHDLSFHLYPNYRDAEFVEHMRKNLSDVVNEASRIICFSQTTKMQLEKFCTDHQLPTIPTDIIYHGIASIFLDHQLQNTKSTLIPSSPYVLSIGALDLDKNLDVVIKAFQNDEFLQTNYKLAVSGLANSTKSTFNKLVNKTTNSFIIPLESISDQELPSLYRNAACFISASIDEGFGFCPLEALACETPVVCSDIACHREVLGDAVKYFNPNDPISCAAALRVALNETAHQTISCELKDTFSWKAAAQKTFEVYQSVSQR